MYVLRHQPATGERSDEPVDGEIDLTDGAVAAGRAGTIADSRLRLGPVGESTIQAQPRRLVAGRAVPLLATLLVVALIVGVVALARVGAPPRGAVLSGQVRVSALAGRPAGVDAYRGPAVWVDIYDYAPAYQQDPARRPAVMPEHVRAIAEAGFRTVFLQTAGTDRRSGAGTADAPLIGRFLAAAHQRGLRVVGWYRPTLTNVAEDLHRLQAAATFEAGGHRFDGLAVDIEANPAVDPEVRSARLVDLSRRLRQETSRLDVALAAVVPPPVLLDDISPEMWPGFPWTELRDFYDVWIPMAYWTMRTGADRDAGQFTRENIVRLRRHLGEPDAVVHALGGVGDAVSEADTRAFVEAARAEGAVGMSIYDYRSVSAGTLGVVASSPPPDEPGDAGELHE